jgi:pimeloyl-ACP methyl ester carboxylesterase
MRGVPIRIRHDANVIPLPTASPVVTRGAHFYLSHEVSYQDAGPADGPIVLLLHGMASDGTTWHRAILDLAERGFRVLAPDLLGHGRSDKPVDTYELIDFSASMYSLLNAVTDLDTTPGRPVIVVGHSFGGAVAMQLAHQYPEVVSHLVLVSAGGLGQKVHPLLRVATLPGAHAVVRLLANRRTAVMYRHPRLHRSLRLSPDAVLSLSRAGRGLSSPESRSAFFQTLRMAIAPTGQRGSMLELDDVSLTLPTLIIWSADDRVVPVAHAHDTHAHLSRSTLRIFPGSTHQPHHHSARRFVDALTSFVSDEP